MTLVRAFFRPSSCIPPSCVLMVLAKEWIDSAYPLFHCSATSTSASSAWRSKWIGLGSRVSLAPARGLTESESPPAGDRVPAATELASGVQGGEDDLHRRPAILQLGDGLHRDPPAVVHDGARAVLAQRHLDPAAEPGHGLVDGVVDDLVHEVMQSA